MKTNKLLIDESKVKGNNENSVAKLLINIIDNYADVITHLKIYSQSIKS